MLSGDLHVIWHENYTTGFNYTAHICCSRIWPYRYAACANTCPKFQAMKSCKTDVTATGTRRRQCIMQVFEYFRYSVYISGKQHCRLKGEIVPFIPRLKSKYSYNVTYRVYKGKGNRVLECSSAQYLIYRNNYFTVGA